MNNFWWSIHLLLHCLHAPLLPQPSEIPPNSSSLVTGILIGLSNTFFWITKLPSSDFLSKKPTVLYEVRHLLRIRLDSGFLEKPEWTGQEAGWGEKRVKISLAQHLRGRLTKATVAAPSLGSCAHLGKLLDLCWLVFPHLSNLFIHEHYCPLRVRPCPR